MRRGHVLALMLVILAALSASVITFTGLINNDIARRQDAAVRTQALWLARSALTTGTVGAHTVATAAGEASVTCDGTTATVTLQGSTATITAEPWTERFVRAPATGE